MMTSRRLKVYLITLWALSGLLIVMLSAFFYANNYKKLSFSIEYNDVCEIPDSVISNAIEDNNSLIISSKVELDKYDVQYLRIEIGKNVHEATARFIGSDVDWNPIYSTDEYSIVEGKNDIAIERKDYPVVILYLTGIAKEDIISIQFRQRIDELPYLDIIKHAIATALIYFFGTLIVIWVCKKSTERGATKKLFLATYILVALSIICAPLLIWYIYTFNVTLEEILYTVNSPLTGADSHFLLAPLCIAAASTLISIVSIILIKKTLEDKLKGRLLRDQNKKTQIILNGIFTVFFIIFAFTITTFARVLDIPNYIQSRLQSTQIYEDYYEQPVISSITSTNNRNLIYIYLESMETTYSLKENGGAQINYNYIPKLTELAENNISFSNTEKLGGFHCTTGAGWTMGAIFSAESGIPFSFPTGGNSMDERESFATGTVTLGDILEKKGYYQEFLCGSEADFGGRRKFFEQHGNYHIFDLNTAIEKGLMTEDQIVWWGFDDTMLYGIAKDELTRIANSTDCFNFTMLTVDTHHVNGWLCSNCGNKYPGRLANVISCADDQLYDFVQWCSEQEWYDNTTIVIQGDHPRMDQTLVNNVDYYDRTVYNCFINTEYDKKKVNCKNREFTPFDMFPTVLASIGFNIPNDRLGLGVNLFSESKTLAEEKGFAYVDGELSKHSEFYANFY